MVRVQANAQKIMTRAKEMQQLRMMREAKHIDYSMKRLKDIAARDGVEFRFGLNATGFGLSLGRIECLRTDSGELRADAYVVAGFVTGAGAGGAGTADTAGVPASSTLLDRYTRPGRNARLTVTASF